MRLPEAAERYLLRIRENHGEALHRRLLSSPHFPLLVKLLSFSPYAGNLLCTREELLTPFLEPGPLRPRNTQELTRELEEKLSRSPDFPSLSRALLRLRQEEIIKILALDLRGDPLERTVRRLTRLAETLLRAALAHLAREHGIPASELLILAFGKFGARELNYASDLDLVYLFTSRVSKAETLRLFELLTRLLNNLVDGDRIWRLDLRLRPGGKESEIALPLEYAREYYLYRLHPFERLALIRARPVAGNLSLGYDLLSELRPVVYPRYLDFSYLEHIRDLKERIRKEARRRGAQEDIKIGEGGIREVEFLAQTLQSIYGGKHPELRVRRILPVLKRLARLGLIPEKEAHELSEAYLFLRLVEHRIQTRYFQQSFRLPREPAALEAIALSLNFPDSEEFLAHLARIRRRVSESFGALLAPACPREKDALLEKLEEALLSGEDLRTASECAGIPEHLLRDLHRKLRAGGPTGERRARALRDLLPSVLAGVLEEKDRTRAFSRIISFLERVGGRFSLYAAFRENPSVLKTLIHLLACSEYLWHRLESRPALAEVLLEPDLPPRIGELERHLLHTSYDEALALLRLFKNEHLIRTAILHLEKRLSVAETLKRLTFLAEGFVRLTYRLTLQRLEEEKGERLSGKFCVLALGKLGAREMGYRSDLDLVFVYDGPEDTGPFSARLAQRLLFYLSLRLPEGEGYPVDARLRPEGRKGPLTVPLSGFLHYYGQEADLWELVAATRLRSLAGNREWGHHLEQELQALLARRCPSREGWRRLLEMRLYMERERAREDAESFNPKLGRGALADLEFLAALARLRKLRQDPTFPETRTLKLLTLLPEGERARESYLFLREVAERLILLYDPPEEDPVYPREYLKSLEPWLGPDLKRRYEEITAFNRKLLEKYFLGDS